MEVMGLTRLVLRLMRVARKLGSRSLNMLEYGLFDALVGNTDSIKCEKERSVDE